MYVFMQPVMPPTNAVLFGNQKERRTFETDKVLSLAVGISFYDGDFDDMWKIVRFMTGLSKPVWELTGDCYGNFHLIEQAREALIAKYPVLGEALQRAKALPAPMTMAKLRPILADVKRVLGPTVVVEKL